MEKLYRNYEDAIANIEVLAAMGQGTYNALMLENAQDYACECASCWRALVSLIEPGAAAAAAPGPTCPASAPDVLPALPRQA